MGKCRYKKKCKNCYRTEQECLCGCGALDRNSLECKCPNAPPCPPPGYLNEQCVCVDECGPGQIKCGGICVPICDEPLGLDRDTCLCRECERLCQGFCTGKFCAAGLVFDEATCKCVACPDDKPDRCNDGCYEQCKTGFTRNPETCDCECPPPKLVDDFGVCVDCPEETHVICNGTCVKKCPGNQVLDKKKCGCYCPPGTTWNEETQLCATATWVCQEKNGKKECVPVLTGEGYASQQDCVNACVGGGGGGGGGCIVPTLPPPVGQTLFCPDGLPYGLVTFVWNPAACSYTPLTIEYGVCGGGGGSGGGGSSGGSEGESSSGDDCDCEAETADKSAPTYTVVCGQLVVKTQGGGLGCVANYVELDYCEECVGGSPSLKSMTYFQFDKGSCGYQEIHTNGDFPCPQSDSSASDSGSSDDSGSSWESSSDSGSGDNPLP